jgi:hypothetical protein
MRVIKYPAGFVGGNSILYGGFSDSTSQPISVADTPQVITMNTTDLVDGVYRDSVNTSRIYCPASGVYNFQFSLQLQSTSASTKTAVIWARINGTDVPDSATDITISGSSTQQVAAWNFLFEMDAGDYFEMAWASDSTTVSLYHSSAQTSPFTRPAIPSVILTVVQVS